MNPIIDGACDCYFIAHVLQEELPGKRQKSGTKNIYPHREASPMLAFSSPPMISNQFTATIPHTLNLTINFYSI